MAIDPKAKSEYDHQSYVFWRSQQRCVRCHKQDAFTLSGRSRCAECVEVNRKQKSSYREKHQSRLPDERKSWYYRMKAERRCVRCGREVEDPRHYTTCASCRARYRSKDAERRLTSGILPKSLASDCGICGICNHRPAMAGRRTCSECYANNMKNLEKANAARDTTNHPWRRADHAAAEMKRAMGVAE